MKRVLIWKNKIWESRRPNIGDQFILKEMICNIKEIDSQIEIIFFSDNCRITKERYGIVPVSLFNPIAVLRSILKADLILFGGGTALSDKSSFAALIVQISVIVVAVLIKKKLLVFL